MKFDDILKEIGEFGLYQKAVFFFACIPVLSVGCFILLNVIALGVPDHRCKLLGLETDSWNTNSPEHKALVNYFIPQSDDYPYDRCNLYDHNISSLQTDGYIPANSSILTCVEWVYDTSIFENTFSKEVNLVCDDALLVSHAQTVYFVGDLVGSIVLGQMSDIIGRKKALYINLMVMLGSSFSLVFAEEFYSFVLIYFVLGCVSTSTMMAAFIIGIENVGPSKRKWTGSLIGLVLDYGSLIMILMTYLLRDWRRIQLSIALPCVIYIFYLCIIPESPRWLLSKGKRKEAIKIITNMAKVNGKELTTEMISSLEVNKVETTGRLWHLFSTKRLAFRTTVLFINWFTVNMAYNVVILNVRNLAGNFYLNLTLLTASGHPSKFLSIALLDRVGRKKLYIGFMMLCSIAFIGTIYPVMKQDLSIQWLFVTLAVMGRMFVTGAFGILYILSSELYPTVLRHVGMGSGSACARAGSILSPYIVQLADIVDSDIAGAIPLTIAGFATFIAALLTLSLPETLNKKLPDTIEEADQFDRCKGQEITVTVPSKIRREYTELK